MSEVVIYKGKDNKIQIEVQFENDTVWLTQTQLVELYKSSKANVSDTLNIFLRKEN